MNQDFINAVTFLFIFTIFDVAFIMALGLCCVDKEFRKAFVEDWKRG